MKIGDKNFNEALGIIAKSPSRVNITINEPVEDNYSNVYPILLHQACAKLIKNLIEAGFAIGVCSKGTWVDKF